MVISHKVLAGSERRLRHGSRAIGAANAQEWVEVTIKVRRRAAMPLPPRPLGQPLTREEFAAQFGADPVDLDLVRNTLARFKIREVARNPAARSIEVGGTVANLEESFRVKLMQYVDGDETYRGRVGALHVPVELSPVVLGVFGLDDRRMVARRSVRRVERRAMTATATDARSWFKPEELAEIYEFPAGDGDGESIGLLEFGGGFFPADLKSFLQAVGAPTTAKVVPVSVSHTSTTSDDDAAGEVMLDVEIVAALCPKATIPIYFGKWSEKGWISVVDAALHDTTNRPAVLSISYGLAEGIDTWTPAALDQLDQAFQEAAQMGITICAAAGDDGTDAQVGDGYAHVNFPASSPHVLSVGGTNLLSANRKSRDAETVWFQGDGLRKDGGGSTGSGVSSHFDKPEWQTVSVTSINPGAKAGRVVPDVAALANFSGYLLVVDGGAAPNGGTSAATPLWASLISRINAARVQAGKARVGYLTPLLYGPVPGGAKTVGATGCFDITSGSNATASGVGGYSAAPGYDATTGWGSPQGNALLGVLP